VVEEDNNIYNTAGIEVKPDFPGGIEKFYKFVGKNYQVPEEERIERESFRFVRSRKRWFVNRYQSNSRYRLRNWKKKPSAF